MNTCEMTLLEQPESQTDYLPCRKPATHHVDDDGHGRTVHLCAKHADRWNRDDDTHEAVPS